MKQLLVILFALFCMQTNAQEYQPMLKDGRSWKLVSPSIFMNEYDLYFTVSVAGDTLVNDIPCKKIVTKCDIPKPWDKGTYSVGAKIQVADGLQSSERRYLR